MAVADWWQQQQTKVILLDLLPNECHSHNTIEKKDRPLYGPQHVETLMFQEHDYK